MNEHAARSLAKAAWEDWDGRFECTDAEKRAYIAGYTRGAEQGAELVVLGDELIEKLDEARKLGA